jgi:glutamate dehydrogenase
MLLTEEEFYENKEEIVAEVLEKLRNLAEMEAKLLFREFGNYRGSLPQASQVVSDTINQTTDALTAALDELSEEDMDGLMSLFKAHLPKTISDIAFDRVKERVPEQYIKNAIASCLASKLVYKEGTKFIQSQPEDRLAQIALEYLSKEKEIASLKLALEGADMPEAEKKRILDLLDAGGARTALSIY